jgi:hypothetical protein
MALQTGCMANVVATKFFLLPFLFLSLISLHLITFLPEGVVLDNDVDDASI